MKKALLAVALLTACDGRPRTSSGAPSSRASVDGPSVAEIDLSHGVAESGASGLFGAPSRRSYVDLVQTIRTLRGDTTTKGVFVRVGDLGLTSAYEVGHLLGTLRSKGLPVVCYAHEYSNATIALGASGCTRLWVSPMGQIETVGLALELVFGKSLLDKLHVTVDFEQVGNYKGAEEPFTRDAPSPESRATMEATMRGLRDAWLTSVVEGRNEPALRDVLEDGPYSPDEAKERKLIDAVGYVEDARDEAKHLAHAQAIATRFGPGESARPTNGLVEILRALGGAGRTGVPHVAVLPANGAIAMSSAGPLQLRGGGEITEHELGRQLQRLTDDPSTKAVVLRIDSPGGSALASDLLWKRLMKLRDQKPLVVSIGSMAASGGYYLASTGTKVLAAPTSIVGSIGVVGGKFAVDTALEQIGVHSETITGAPDPAKAHRAGYNSPLVPWDAATRERARKSMEAAYDVFLKRVAEGRRTSVDAIKPSAEGRIFAGTEAKNRGLVDELGGLEDAVRIALDLAKLPDDAPIELVSERPSLFDLIEGNGDDARTPESAASAARIATELAPALARYEPEIATFLRAWAPALGGEQTIAALPYLMLVR